VEHTDFVIAQSRLLRSIIDQETALRGYLLSRDSQFLQPYHSAEASVPGLFDQLRRETADNPEQQKQLEAVGRVTNAGIPMPKMELPAPPRTTPPLTRLLLI
jgi:CHASE3 domain sensor protein